MEKSWIKHKCSKESENALIEFLKTAKAHKTNAFCDLNKYEIWRSFIEEDIDLEQKFEGNVEDLDLIDTEGVPHVTPLTIESKNLVDNTQTTCEDITSSIKEHLQSLSEISDDIFRELQKCSSEVLREIFTALSKELKTKQIIVFGESIEMHFKDDHVIECFCNCILFKMMLTVFDEDIKIFFLQFCERFKEVVRKQVIISINNNDHLDILLLYLNSLKPTMQEEILRELLREPEHFPKKYLLVFDCLLLESIEYECLKKLVETMANNVEQYVTDKEYGKLLIKVTQYLGNNLTQVKNPLRHILGCHKSIWKAKLQKICNNNFEKSLYFESQTIE